jgi:peptidoglycan/xylan/chitin deacetylase (PgdA/CDA1 family)
MGRLLAAVQRRFAVRGAILMYHRIATVACDPWGLCVSPEAFTAQLEHLRDHYQVLPLPELLAALQSKTLPPRAVAITFDDGYADNHWVARPLLERHGLPATFFITSGYIGQQREFWWDELERALLGPDDLPARLSLQIGATRFEQELGEARRYDPGVGQRPRQVKPWEARPTSRLGFYYTIWQRLLPLPHYERQEILAALITWAGASPEPRPTHRAMTGAELQEFARSSIVTVGGHTVTHAPLAAHPSACQQAEMDANIATLTGLLQQPVQLFSYPHGEYTSTTVELARAAGIKGACTVAAEPVWHGCDPWRLPRFAVEDWPQVEFAGRLARWLS